MGIINAVVFLIVLFLGYYYGRVSGIRDERKYLSRFLCAIVSSTLEEIFKELKKNEKGEVKVDEESCGLEDE